MMEKKLICISCPMGCELLVKKVDSSDEGYVVEGNQCDRGRVYGIKEMSDPTRTLPTTVKIKNGQLNRLPVKTDQPISKALLFKCMEVINQIEVEAPIQTGQIIIRDILGTGINIVATRNMEKS